MYAVTVNDETGSLVGTVAFNTHKQAQDFCRKVMAISNGEADPILTMVHPDPQDILDYWSEA